MSVPFNPAQHGGTIEDYRNISRSGTMWFLAGLVCLALTVLFFFLWTGTDTDFSTLIIGAFFVFLGLTVLFIAIGVGNLADAQAFRARVRYLTTPGNGNVTRGTIMGVRNRFAVWGRTYGTQAGDSLAMDTGWFYKVDYAFEYNGRTIKATGIIPDPLGPNRRNNSATTFMDPHMPRRGMHVDVLYATGQSVILRMIPAT